MLLDLVVLKAEHLAVPHSLNVPNAFIKIEWRGQTVTSQPAGVSASPRFEFDFSVGLTPDDKRLRVELWHSCEADVLLGHVDVVIQQLDCDRIYGSWLTIRSPASCLPPPRRPSVYIEVTKRLAEKTLRRVFSRNFGGETDAVALPEVPHEPDHKAPHPSGGARLWPVGEKSDSSVDKVTPMYIGEWKGRKKNGQGRQVWSDGAIYEGIWVDGVRCGKGISKHPNGDVYEGDWKNDKRHGIGTYTKSDGSRYSGSWKHGLSHGEGKANFEDGSRFEGQYMNGKQEGRGKLFMAHGSLYDGEWKNDKIHGWGRYVWNDGRWYAGQFQNDRKHGFGCEYGAEGDSYTGQFQLDEFYGYGEYKSDDGGCYAGWWKHGEKHGLGFFKTPQSTEQVGLWVNGELKKLLKPKEAAKYQRGGGISPPSPPSFPSWLDTNPPKSFLKRQHSPSSTRSSLRK